MDRRRAWGDGKDPRSGNPHLLAAILPNLSWSTSSATEGPALKRRPSRKALVASHVYQGFARIAPRAARVLESRNSQTFPDEPRSPPSKSKSLLLSRFLSRGKLGGFGSTADQSTVASTANGHVSERDSGDGAGDSDGEGGSDEDPDELPERLPDRLNSASSMTSVRSATFESQPPRRLSYSSTVSSCDSDGPGGPGGRLTSVDSEPGGEIERPPASELRSPCFHGSVGSTSSVNTNGLLRIALGMGMRSGRRMHSINELNTALDDMQEENEQMNCEDEVRREKSLKLGFGSPMHRDVHDDPEVDAANSRLADALALIRADVSAEDTHAAVKEEAVGRADVPGMVVSPENGDVAEDTVATAPGTLHSAASTEESPTKWDEWRARKEAKAARKGQDKRPKYGELLKNGSVNTAK